MNDLPAQTHQSSPRLRVTHALCVAVAVISVLPTLATAIKSAPYDGIEITAFGVFTLIFAHIALFLGRRVYSRTENSGRFLTFFALITGYLCAGHGLYLLFA